VIGESPRETGLSLIVGLNLFLAFSLWFQAIFFTSNPNERPPQKADEEAMRQMTWSGGKPYGNSRKKRRRD